jgi:hypothetical protein
MRSSKPTKRERGSAQGSARRAPAARSLSAVVGDDVYGVWVAMVRRVGPGGRTHRLAVVIASMLQHAALVASEGRSRRRGRVAGADQKLLIALQEPEPGGENEELAEAIVQLFDDAGVPHSRTSRRGDEYSIVDASIEEFVRWLDMPWEG